MEKKQHGIAFTNLIKKKKGWFLHLDYRPLIGRPRHPPPPPPGIFILTPQCIITLLGLYNLTCIDDLTHIIN